MSSDYKKGQLELSPGQDLETLKENYFQKFKVLPFQSQYIFSLVLFVENNEDQIMLNSEIHSINTRQNSNLYETPSNLTMYQKGTYYFGIKIFNNLPSDIKNHLTLLNNLDWPQVIFLI